MLILLFLVTYVTKETGCSSANKNKLGGVNDMRGGLRYQVVIAANSLTGSIILWTGLLAIGAVIAALLVR